MPDIPICVSVICAPVIRILWESAIVGIRRDVQSMRPGIRHKCSYAVAKPLAKFDTHPLIIRDLIVLNRPDVPKQLIGSPRSHRGARTRKRRVVVKAAIQMKSVRADVLNVDCRTVPQSSLYSERPLIHVRCGQVWIRGNDVENPRGSTGGNRARICEGNRGRRRRGTSRDSTKWWIAAKEGKGVCLIRIVIDPKPRAYHGFVRGAIRQAEARGKVLVSRIDESKSWLRSGRRDQGRLCRVQNSCVTVHRVWDGWKFV